jgi:hypothetical protein
VLGLAAGQRPYWAADRVGGGRAVADEWRHRFNAEDLKGLTDHPRPGRPPTDTPDQRAEVIAAALTRPESLDLPFASWPLDRLQAYRAVVEGPTVPRPEGPAVRVVGAGAAAAEKATASGNAHRHPFVWGRRRRHRPRRPPGVAAGPGVR